MVDGSFRQSFDCFEWQFCKLKQLTLTTFADIHKFIAISTRSGDRTDENETVVTQAFVAVHSEGNRNLQHHRPNSHSANLAWLCCARNQRAQQINGSIKRLFSNSKRGEPEPLRRSQRRAFREGVFHEEPETVRT
jgi:hypothetical protein